MTTAPVIDGGRHRNDDGDRDDIPRVTLEAYNDLLDRLGFRPGGASEPGCPFHYVTPTEDGFRGVDVWESPEAFDRFVRERLGPVLEHLDITPPDVAVWEVHNYLAAPPDRRGGDTG